MASLDTSLGSVLGRHHMAKRSPKVSRDSDRTETPKWISIRASLGEKAKPTENPASKRLKDGALHLGFMTSLRADRATATQFTNPVAVPAA